jgi:hypothetical protein
LFVTRCGVRKNRALVGLTETDAFLTTSLNSSLDLSVYLATVTIINPHTASSEDDIRMWGRPSTANPIVSELFVEEFSHGDAIMSRGPCLEPYLTQVIPNVPTSAQTNSLVYGPFKEMWTKQMFGKYCDELLSSSSTNRRFCLLKIKKLSFVLRSAMHSPEKITLSLAGIFWKMW